MKCPYCNRDMTLGCMNQDRYAIKWVKEEDDKGLFNFTPLVKGIKLTSMAEDKVKVFYCQPCRKFLIDQDDLRL